MMEERISAWAKAHFGKTPHIVFYRDGLEITKDGVVDAKVEEVVHAEMAAIRDAAKVKFNDIEPVVSYILVNKRANPPSPYGHNMETICKDRGIHTSSHVSPDANRYQYEYHELPVGDNHTPSTVDLEKLVRQCSTASPSSLT
jgi:hypothetical protein